jgi:hypothetical protein
MTATDAALLGEVLVLGFLSGTAAGIVVDTVVQVWAYLTRPAPRQLPCPLCARRVRLKGEKP